MFGICHHLCLCTCNICSILLCVHVSTMSTFFPPLHVIMTIISSVIVPLPASHKQQSDIFMSVSGLVETCLSLFSLTSLFRTLMLAVNAQKPSFVIDRVHFDLDSQQGLSLGLLGPCSVYFTQLLLNPVRGIGFGRSGISLGFTI